jgi:diacylglycerol kinase
VSPLLALVLGAVAVALPAYCLAVARRARRDYRAAKKALPGLRTAWRTAALRFAAWAALGLVVLAAALAASQH